jgi:hypothetical protein
VVRRGRVVTAPVDWFPGDPPFEGAVVDRWWDEGGDVTDEDGSEEAA